MLEHDGGRGPLLEMRRITKRFPGVVALADVSFECRAGEVHALVGENGAGKSTLVKVLSGAYPPDEGEVVFDGRPYASLSPEEARRLGIAVIYQDFNLIPELSVAENLFLGGESRTRLGLVDFKALRRRSEALLARLRVGIDVRRPVSTLTVAQQQIVEIAKALALDARLVVMDEPSAVIGGEELDQLFAVIESLRAQAVGVVYISHRLDEIFRITDRVTVLKDGRVMGMKAIAETTRSELIRLMVGRSLEEEFPPPTASPGEPLLSVRGLCAAGFLREISFELRAGEILGVAGLVGSGRTSLGLTLYGVYRMEAGQMAVNGRAGQPRSPLAAIRRGIVLVPEDRKRQGLLLEQSVRFNLSLPTISGLARLGLIQRRAEERLAEAVISRLAIRPPEGGRHVQFLSGGNQQKVVLGKWLSMRPRLVIMDEPTRGVDVGGKMEIYRRMRELQAEGVGVLMISSELPEVLGMSDRILVLREGRSMGVLDASKASEEAIMRLATGHTEDEPSDSGQAPAEG